MNDFFKSLYQRIHYYRLTLLVLFIGFMIIIVLISVSKAPDVNYSFPTFSKTYQGIEDVKEVDYIFPTQNISNFFSSKPRFKLQDANEWINKKFSIDLLQENFDFTFVKYFKSENRIEIYESGEKTFDLIMSKGSLIGYSYVYFTNKEIDIAPDYYVQEYLRANKMISSFGKLETNYAISKIPTLYSFTPDMVYSLSIKTDEDIDFMSNDSVSQIIRDRKFSEVIITVFNNLDRFNTFLTTR